MKFSIITLSFFLLISTSSCTNNNNKKNEQENVSTNYEALFYNNPEIKKLNNLIDALKERLSEDIKKDSIPNHIDVIEFLNICCSNYIDPPILTHYRNETNVVSSYIDILKHAATKDILMHGHFALYIDEERLTQNSQEIFDEVFEPELIKVIVQIVEAVKNRKSYKDAIMTLNVIGYDGISHDIPLDAKTSEINDALDRIRRRKPLFIKKCTRERLSNYLDSSPTFVRITMD